MCNFIRETDYLELVDSCPGKIEVCMVEKKALYDNIRKFRKEKKLSQGDLAKMTGYASNSMIAQVENGNIDLQYTKIIQFAEALDVPVPVLLGYVDEDSAFAELEDLPKHWQDYMYRQLMFAKQNAKEEKENGGQSILKYDLNQKTPQ